MKDKHYPTSRFVEKLQKSRECGTGKRTDKQMNGTESTEKDPHKYRQLISDIRPKAIQ